MNYNIRSPHIPESVIGYINSELALLHVDHAQ